jgi:uncharacterized protein YjbJ (UPF0337 family)
MTKLQEKAQGQVKQIVGQMIGDHQLEQEGREQQQKADQAKQAGEGNPDAATAKGSNQKSARSRSKEK